MKVLRTLAPATRRHFSVLFVIGLLFWSSLASLLPTLSLYVESVGATRHQVGIVMGAFAIGLLLFRPWVGNLADSKGRRVVLLIGLWVAAIAPLGYLFTTSIPLLIGIRIFHGLSIAAFTTGYSALVADLSPLRQRGELIGYMSLVTPIGMAVGPALGGFVQASIGYTVLFLMAAGFGLVGLIGAIGGLPATPFVAPNLAMAPNSRPSGLGFEVILSPRLRIPALVMLMVGLAFGTLSTFVPLFIKETGVALNAGLFYAAAAIASFAMRILVGRASDHYGRGRFITLGLLLYAISMLLLWQAHSATEFLLAGAIEGAGAGVFLPMMITLAADRSRPDERGRVFGLCMAGFDLGIAISGPTLGFLADQLGYRGLFGLSAVLVAVALLVFISLSSKSFTASIHYALGSGKDFYAISQTSD